MIIQIEINKNSKATKINIETKQLFGSPSKTKDLEIYKHHMKLRLHQLKICRIFSQKKMPINEQKNNTCTLNKTKL